MTRCGVNLINFQIECFRDAPTVGSATLYDGTKPQFRTRRAVDSARSDGADWGIGERQQAKANLAADHADKQLLDQR